MTDEKLITDFLEKNYIVKTHEYSFAIHEKGSYTSWVPSQFVDIFQKIFGDFMTMDNEKSMEIFQRWFSLKKRLLTLKLTEYMENNVSGEEGSVAGLAKTIKHFVKGKRKKEYTESFITNYFNEFYKENFMRPLVIKLRDLFNVELGSTVLIKDLENRIENENPQQREYALNFLNEWYSETVIGKKLETFFNELVITLGPRNWIVTWVGHGALSREKLLRNFLHEDEYHHKYIMKMYDKWYELEVIEASERMMNRNSYSNTFPSVNLGRNEL
jgi:hypothetical protein